MTREPTYHCDGPDCQTRVSSMNQPPVYGWIEVRERVDGVTTSDFCSWDCVMKFAAKVEPMEVLP